MTTTTTVHFQIGGDSYSELKENAEAAIHKFLETSSDPEYDLEDEDEYETDTSKPKVNYELIVKQTNDVSSEFEYTAEVIARLKDVH